MSESKQVQRIRGTVEKVGSGMTIRVSSRVTKIHPLYRKRYTQLRHYVAHDPSESCAVGDEVTLVACRPISKSKHWIVEAPSRLTQEG